jgi:Flp pilus assembly protein TadG
MKRRKDENGAVALTVALVVTLLLAVASFALDLGLARVGVRDMQAVADVVALDMARQIDGRTVSAIEADTKWL